MVKQPEKLETSPCPNAYRGKSQQQQVKGSTAASRRNGKFNTIVNKKKANKFFALPEVKGNIISDQ